MIRILQEESREDRAAIFAPAVSEIDVSSTVREIIARVRSEGDAALYAYCEKFDRVKLDALEVTREEIDEAFLSVEEEFLDIMRRAKENIELFHSHQVRNGFMTEKNGVILGQKITPIERVGLYVPGGTAAYPSSVLMNAIPAKLAGCPMIVMVTPPGKDGRIPSAILAAAKIAGVDRIFKVGGAQAVAALAYGTETLPQVDKIVGPGNMFVAEAKRQVYGQVAIDMIAGPSEILIVADGTCDPDVLAADMLSQAEHDRMASAVLVTDDKTLAEGVRDALERRIPRLLRSDIARASIDHNGKIILTKDIPSAIDMANAIAPEHLELCLDHPFDYLPKLKNAGSIFLGKHCPEALGDYFAGPNHTLPTSGTARFSSPLSVDDFVKKSQYTYYTADALQEVAADVAYFARKEGLTAHAESAEVRGERGGNVRETF
jgi:histidinol dehydrogenase